MRRTSRAASPPSSAMSGRQTPAETIFIAMSSGATTAQRRASSSHTRPCRRSAVPIRAICGSGWPTTEEKTGAEILALAHNGNLSNGRMFPIIESFTGKRIDREYAENRVRWEPLYEATQIKGDGETHPFLSPNDEFANFERWDKGNLDLTEVKKPEMLEFEYARSALKNGLKMEAELGVNPYKFGLVGSTDAHTGLAGRRGG